MNGSNTETNSKVLATNSSPSQRSSVLGTTSNSKTKRIDR
ncbi:hypothetical protein FRUB_06696 [Fimbriiglobus ruber]|uniref:Uncharacterized protein n=1 Tax=Fimbriiglobus ruber TaxID=1908690 RepID=A0A225DJF9_9BACT|nr:hypothetical protein FRUB_06696 [Fimbriiglobus ruber]